MKRRARHLGCTCYACHRGHDTREAAARHKRQREAADERDAGMRPRAVGKVDR